MSGMLKKIVRAAVAQPWEYLGEGAPAEWEFRISPDEDRIAIWNPALGQWVICTQVIGEQHLTQAQGERELSGWSRFVEELDDE